MGAADLDVVNIHARGRGRLSRGVHPRLKVVVVVAHEEDTGGVRVPVPAEQGHRIDLVERLLTAAEGDDQGRWWSPRVGSGSPDRSRKVG